MGFPFLLAFTLPFARIVEVKPVVRIAPVGATTRFECLLLHFPVADQPLVDRVLLLYEMADFPAIQRSRNFSQ